MELKVTTYEIDDDGVVTVTLSRPARRNAWTGRMHTEYRWCVAQAEADPRARVVIVTGAGDAFSVGGDSDALAGHAERGSYDAGIREELADPGYGVHPYFDAHFAWQYGLRLPLIAAINGACAGVALALASFCDLRFVRDDARLTTAAPKLGLPAEYGLSWTLPRLVGVTHAADLLLSGRVFTGAEAASMGFANKALPAAELLAHVRAYATDLARHVSPASVRATKRQLYDDLVSHDVGAAVVRSEVLLDQMMGGPEYREGVRALREKRRPRFRLP